jgi:release factor glutamine methyltransferase
MIYEPREDSELLGRVVQTHARGRTCDIGTGSGYLARIAHERGCTVTAFDINKRAVDALQSEPFRVVHASSITALRGRFNTVICNPPYLPNDPEGTDPALHGGKKGYEYIVRVLKEVSSKLAPGGQFLFLISTLTKPLVVEKALRDNGYEFTIAAREKLFMEELFVYRATLILDRAATLLGEGWRSRVYAVSPTVAVKVTAPARAHKESVLLRAANKVGVGVRLLRVKGGAVWLRRVHGERFDEYVRRTKDVRVARAALAQCYKLDCAGIRKHELNRPAQNILVTETKRVVFIDFERSIFAPKPGNVLQLASFLANVFGVDVRAACQAYKANPTKKNYLTIVRAFTAR